MSDIIEKSVPNALTCSSLISGYIATCFAFAGDTRMALIWILAGAAPDFFDGMSARFPKISSPIGKKLDSLAGCVTFGTTPSTMVSYEFMAIDYPSFLTTPEAFSFDLYHTFVPFLTFLVAAFSTLRLAEFSIDTRRADSFIGLPTPANALFQGPPIVANPAWLENNTGALVYILVLLLLSCYPLASKVPVFIPKSKNFKWQGSAIRHSFTIFTAVVLITSGVSRGWWTVIACYFLTSLGLLVTGRPKVTKMNHDKEQKL